LIDRQDNERPACGNPFPSTKILRIGSWYPDICFNIPQFGLSSSGPCTTYSEKTPDRSPYTQCWLPSTFRNVYFEQHATCPNWTDN
jgi:hypothetical protein